MPMVLLYIMQITHSQGDMKNENHDLIKGGNPGQLLS